MNVFFNTTASALKKKFEGKLRNLDAKVNQPPGLFAQT